MAVQDAGGAVDAEAALARTHPEPQLAADVVEVRGAETLHRLLQPVREIELALADHLLVDQIRLLVRQARAEQVVRRRSRIRAAARSASVQGRASPS